MNNKEQIVSSSKEVNQMSRRRVLKAMGTVLYCGSLEAVARPIGRSLAVLRLLGAVPKDSVPGRYAILNELIERAHFNPTEDKKQLLTAWLKFNAAEYYASSQGWSMTAACIHNFLYGSNNLEVSTLYPNLLVNSRPVPPGGLYRNTISDELGHELTATLLTYRDTFPIEAKRFPVSIDNKSTIQKLLDEKKLPLQIGLRAVVSGNGPDISYSMNRHTLALTGLLQEATFIKEDRFGSRNYWDVVLAPNSHWRVYDRYDWEKSKAFNSQGGAVQFAENLFPQLRGRLDAVLGSDNYNSLLNSTSMTLTDYEGALLEETGYGKAFDITGSFQVKEPVPFQIHESLLK